MTRRKKISLFLVVLLFILAGIEWRTHMISFCWFLSSIEIQERMSRVPFDSASWKSHEPGDEEHSLRIRMVDDLVDHHRLVGMSKKQVSDLLGKADAMPDGCYWYVLGRERGWISIDYEILVLEFDKRGIVTKVRITVT